MSPPLFVLGAGGHAKVVLAALEARGERVAGVLDDDPARHGAALLGHPVLGGLDLLARHPAPRAVIAVGSNRARRCISRRWPHVRWASVVHPAAWVHGSAHVGDGAVVFAGAVVQPEGRVGAHAIVNTGASVDHDSAVGDFAHLAPGARLGGHVHVDEGAFLGVASAVIPGLRVGAWSTVGAGAVVVRDVAEGLTVVGVPARPLG